MSLTRSVTEVARHFSDYINRVAFRQERFILMRGKRPVAELRPVHAGVRACDLLAVFASFPHLGPDEAQAFEADIDEARRRLDAIPLHDHWAE